jgi:hypothetical protein
MQIHIHKTQETYIIENDYKVYDFKKCLAFIESQGKTHYGQSFKINFLDIPII